MAAIYIPLWPEGQIVVTTTPYPVEYSEGMQVGATVSGGWMSLIPSDHVDSAHTVLNMTYVQTRWWLEDGPYADGVESAHTVLDMTYVQTRWWLEDGPYDDNVENTHEVLDMTYIRGRVEADTPDEGLQLAIVIRPTCTMDAV